MWYSAQFYNVHNHGAVPDGVNDPEGFVQLSGVCRQAANQGRGSPFRSELPFSARGWTPGKIPASTNPFHCDIQEFVNCPRKVGVKLHSADRNGLGFDRFE